MTTAAATRRRQQVEDLCAAAVRAVSGDPLLHFRGHRLHRGAEPYPASAPHLQPTPDDDFRSFRGAADGLALRRRHSDPLLHHGLRPDDEVAGMLFDMLEQFRTEALADPTMPGLVANLRHRHVTWSRAFHRSGLTETSGGIMIYTLAQISRSRLTGEPVVQNTEDLLEATRFGLVPQIGAHLVGLRRNRDDQACFAVPALAIARHVAALLADAATDVDQEDACRATHRDAFSLFANDDTEDADVPNLGPPADAWSAPESSGGYRVFTRVHDREHEAGAMVRPALLAELRQRLDDRVASQAINVARLALEMRAALTDPSTDGWDSDREQGRIDGRKLARLVTSPGERRVFLEERSEPVADALVTFLVDCSGSMRRRNETVAMVLDALIRALDLAGVTTELLGFTTSAWNGGRPMKEWRRVGRPRHPGRLNEVCHIVFKDADTSWRRARRGIAALLKDDLYREGVDGEAVTWALKRMRDRTEQVRLLVVVTDGAPMDSATILANDPLYLDRHLHRVVTETAATGEVRLCGIGVGLDLSAFYPESIVLDLDTVPSNRVFRDVVDLFARSRR
jgi:cobaltochelatase CobT